MNPNNSYQSNPFDAIANDSNPFAFGGNAPSNGNGINNNFNNPNEASSNSTSTGYTPKAMDDGKLNDLLNPFAVIGLESKPELTNPNPNPKPASLLEQQKQQQQDTRQNQQQSRASMMPSQGFFPSNPTVASLNDPFNSFNNLPSGNGLSSIGSNVTSNQNRPPPINNDVNVDPFASFNVSLPPRRPSGISSSLNQPVPLNSMPVNNNHHNNNLSSDPFGPNPFGGGFGDNVNNNQNNNNFAGFPTTTFSTANNNSNNNNNNSNTPTFSAPSNNSINNNHGFGVDFSDFDAFGNNNNTNGGLNATSTNSKNNSQTNQNVIDDDDDFGISWDSPPSSPTGQDQSNTDTDAEEDNEEIFEEEDDNNNDETNKKNERESNRNGISPAKYMNSNRVNPNGTNNETEKEKEITEGYILARISTRTLLVKEWKKTYWVILKEQAKLLLYRSREDYLYNPVGKAVKKEQLLTANIRCSEITCKEYSGYGDLYHFTVEELLDYGPILVAKFSTLELKPLRTFRAAIMSIVIEQRKKLMSINSQRSRNGSFVHGDKVRTNNNTGFGNNSYSNTNISRNNDPQQGQGQRPTPTSKSATAGQQQQRRERNPQSQSKQVEQEDKYSKWGTIDNID